MKNNVAKVLNGYLALSASDRQEFVKEINKYINGDERTKRVLNEEVSKSFDAVNFGPAPGGCPCCGK